VDRAQLGNILVIKLGALGDFVLACGPFQAIRRYHPGSRITLLTTGLYRSLAAACGWFDEILIDTRPRPWQVGQWLALRRRLLDGRFARVYDLQTSDRSGWYFRLMRSARPEWSGAARGCSHPHDNPKRDFMHTLDRQAEQLAMAGIDAVPPPEIDWLDADVGRFGLADSFALLIPGGAAHRPDKRWPVGRYAALAGLLMARGLRPVLVGGPEDALALAAISKSCPEAVDLSGETDLFEVAGLARRAAVAVGNDTGPMHLAAAVGCRSVVLFSHASDPALCAARGQHITILRHESLAGLSVAEVEAALRLR
jgi:ADP-heptose:LPS heptosyltransferase